MPIAGRPPSLINLPGGCSFHPRCPYVREAHKRVDPTLEPVDGDAGHHVACLLDARCARPALGGAARGQTPGGGTRRRDGRGGAA